jgi:hypothetical protein
MLCSWVFRFAEPQHCRDGLNDLPFSLSNSTFHDFKLCCGSTWILAELHCRDGLDDLPLLLSNYTFHDFKLCCGSLHMDSTQEHIARSVIDADKDFLGGLCWQMMGPGK